MMGQLLPAINTPVCVCVCVRITPFALCKGWLGFRNCSKAVVDGALDSRDGAFAAALVEYLIAREHAIKLRAKVHNLHEWVRIDLTTG